MDHREPPADSAAMRVLSRAAARELDRLAVDELGIPSIVLMENAAIGATRALLGLAAARSATAVLAVCGPGNNGGDGFAVARHAANAGLHAACAATFAPAPAPADEPASDAAVNRVICGRMGISITHAAEDEDSAEAGVLGAAARLAGLDVGSLIVVDAVFGTGLNRPAVGAAAGAIRAINRLRAMGAAVLALDIPSGLDAETGLAFDPVVIADRTVTFAAAKRGMIALPAQEYIGELFIGGIGVPDTLIDRLAVRIPPRRDTSSGTSGQSDVERGGVAGTHRYGRREAINGRASDH